MTLISRADAAEILRCTERTVSRFARNGDLTKYAGPAGTVRFSRKECKQVAVQLGRTEATPPPAPAPQPTSPPRKRW